MLQHVQIFQPLNLGKVVFDEMSRRLYGFFEFGSFYSDTVTDALRFTDLLVVSPTGPGKSNAYKILMKGIEP
ncbi:DEHA2D00858p [Debaryomyces hansenii CBS767]|uniref:DEHA2D00858p n=1 Tax=Debaryomyces hansenii (strain ATCC 36239 / CBS 767 / BCRC 21394 / JCM 1990 / NBRC 0083 / IGC 2968) TaxID=284592 RepID=Q6BTG2_DEBHA|nr:DEHA2D00858p [Debaryomyces hansenii CBS767]CAG86627.1 DEHA2D00858p [Debaryomyces hansenii CBS767]|eukprot:XP_458507.1 DEHA2D00858p [Debaryomyces hansenii CBS767]